MNEQDKGGAGLIQAQLPLSQLMLDRAVEFLEPSDQNP